MVTTVDKMLGKMSEYGENLHANVFFASLKYKHADLWQWAVDNGLTIVVPRKCVADKEQVKGEHVFMRHILVESERDGVYQNSLSEEVVYEEGRLQLNHVTGGCQYSPVRVLFEETFFTDDDRPYRVICTDHFLTNSKKSEAELFTRKNEFSFCNEDKDFVVSTLFGLEKDFRFQSNIEASCDQFNQQLARSCALSLQNLRKIVLKQLSDTCQLIIRRHRRLSRQQLERNDVNNLKLATELYFFEFVGPTLLQLLRGTICEEESQFNRMRLSCLESVQGKPLAFSPCIIEKLEAELVSLNGYQTPRDRLMCLRRVIAAMTNNMNSRLSCDDLLPALVHLLIHSYSVTDWCTNIQYISDYYVSLSSGDELRYCLASFEAACEYVKRNIAIQMPSPSTSIAPVVYCNDSYVKDWSEFATSILDVIERNDETRLRQLLAEHEPLAANVSPLCHPLCRCNICSMNENSRFDCNSVISDLQRTPLHMTAIRGRPGLMSLLLNHSVNANVNAADQKGSRPLHLACQSASQSCTLLLLYFGADASLRNDREETPLHIAAKFGSLDCLKALLFFEHRSRALVNVNAVDDRHETALHHSVRFHHADLVRLLLESGANRETKNVDGHSPMSICNNMAIRKLLHSVTPSFNYISVNQTEQVEVREDNEAKVTK